MTKYYSKYWLPVWLYMGLIFYLSAQSHLDLGSVAFDYFDKVLHFSEYAFLSFLYYRAFIHVASPAIVSRAVWLAIVCAILYAITDELHQMFVPHRDADFFDILADSAGAVTSQLLLFWCRRSRFCGWLLN